MIPSGSTAVMARRVEPPDSLDYFPTPPWATRALVERVLIDLGTVARAVAWDPACGEGHMAEPLAEYFENVWATDIFDYSSEGQDEAIDFLSEDARDFCRGRGPIDWIITNPPFKVAIDFTLRSLEFAEIGVAMLVRTQWIESSGRYERLFRDRPPTIFAPFVERVPMVKGCWDPTASTATSYAWFVWLKGSNAPTVLKLIPPGCRKSLTHAADVGRFGKRTPAPLLA